MSCNAPTQKNLSKAPTEPCSNSCPLFFKYEPSSQLNLVTDTSMGNYKINNRDLSKHPPVTYKSSKYNMQYIYIFKGPLHNYGDDNPKVQSEVIITHNIVSGNENSNKYLYICIPVIYGQESNTELDKLFTDINNAGPHDDEITTLNTNNFKIDKLIPEDDYLVYTGNNLVGKDNNNKCPIENTTYIVFNNLKNALSVAEKNLNKTFNGMKDANTKYQLGPTIDKNTILYKSQNVPDNGPSEDIYIDCRPVQTTDTKTDFVPVVTGLPAYLSGLSFDEILNSLFPYFLIIIGIVIMYIMYKFGYYMFGPKCPGSGCAPPGPPLKCPNTK